MAEMKLFASLPEPITELSSPEWAVELGFIFAYTKSGVYLVFQDGSFSGPHFGPLHEPINAD